MACLPTCGSEFAACRACPSNGCGYSGMVITTGSRAVCSSVMAVASTPIFVVVVVIRGWTAPEVHRVGIATGVWAPRGSKHVMQNGA